MIEIIEAHEKGERLEYKPKLEKDWHLLPEQYRKFDFGSFDYRIQPKEEVKFKPNFKVGDFVLSKDRENTPINQEPHEILGIEPDTYFIDDPCLSEIPFEDEDKYIKADDCLWYWEWWDDVEKLYCKSCERYTKKRILSLFSSDLEIDLTPLYALGFKLPGDTK